jgi:TRAP-type transport system small permease protein
MARLRALYEKILELLVIVLMVALAVEVTAGVVFRTLGSSLVWYDEVAAILLAWLTFYGSALAAAKRAHIGCPEVVAAMPPAVRLFLRIVVEILVIGFFVLLGWVGFSILDVLATDNLVSLPQVSVKYTQSVIPIAAVLIVVAELLTLPAVLAEARRGQARTDAAGASSQ